ncbi:MULTISPECIES: NAD(+)/NADH kinase [Pyrobaculum]|uniref:NAD(+)/NADH kinase n=1 Tax=Pyrobaculum arsenaticum TaxID=121277 RepID=A0A7L4PB38_9CREN|nr:NAD(+)/NADH kinase [Pyrobaculum arsenaticum]MCY0891478.1 NAD(+)/NADH kinase [Pyrobaculum arsenaticum]NYR16148.1 NAD(+)/NADH kinase [Pyrobaculum arsenaticum]
MVFAVYYRPDLREAAWDFKRRYGAVDLSCNDKFTHVFIFGGDGTLLEAIRRYPCVLDSVVVHLGLGRVNFYRSAQLTIPVDDAVRRVLENNYDVLELSTLDAGGCIALNEVSVYRREPGKMLNFAIRTDEGEVVGRADGIIVSTPHGTSGYVVSTFGPVVDYRADVIVVSFVAPYTLYLRPLVLASKSVEIEINEETVLVCDGRAASTGRYFKISKGQRRLRLAVFGEFQFLDRVAERLRSL